jgi:hypothetical protein
MCGKQLSLPSVEGISKKAAGKWEKTERKGEHEAGAR